MTFRNPKSSRIDKIKFVADHPELWNRPYSEIKKALADAGLVSRSTYIYDLRIPGLLREAKKLKNNRVTA